MGSVGKDPVTVVGGVNMVVVFSVIFGAMTTASLSARRCLLEFRWETIEAYNASNVANPLNKY